MLNNIKILGLQKEKFSFKSRLKSFGHAFNGLRVLIVEEHNFRIHIIAATLAVALSFYFQVSYLENLAVIFAIAIVVCAEILNTCIENICNFISPEYNQSIKKIKDMSAALVLISSVVAAITGMIIFLPKIILKLTFDVLLN